jgi:DNA-directed RNA polymerase specialized sigma24 family protein
MENLRKLLLLGPDGKPLEERLHTIFSRLLPKFVRRFPAFQDTAEIQNYAEEAARRFLQKEQQSGKELEKPWGYAWTALESVGISAERTRGMRVRFRTVESGTDSAIVSQLRAWDGSVDQMEQRITLNQIRAMMTPEERWMFDQKACGYSSEAIGRVLGISANAVDQVMSRLRSRIRAAAGIKE